MALEIEPESYEGLYCIANAFAFLFHFDISIKIYQYLRLNREILKVKALEMQYKGNYWDLIENFHKMELYEQKYHIINYIHPGLEIKMTKKRGRGIFATKDFTLGDMLIVEKPIVYSLT